MASAARQSVPLAVIASEARQSVPLAAIASEARQSMPLAVIASAARQSMNSDGMDCRVASLLAMTRGWCRTIPRVALTTRRPSWRAQRGNPCPLAVMASAARQSVPLAVIASAALQSVPLAVIASAALQSVPLVVIASAARQSVPLVVIASAARQSMPLAVMASPALQSVPLDVMASAALQSMNSNGMDCRVASLLAMTMFGFIVRMPFGRPKQGARNDVLYCQGSSNAQWACSQSFGKSGKVRKIFDSEPLRTRVVACAMSGAR